MKFLSREEYHNLMKELPKSYCPFCDKKWQKWHTLWEWKYWYVLNALSPYSWDHRHIMAVPNEHIKLSTELTLEHFQELKEVHDFVKSYFGEENYFSFTRETLWDDTRSQEHLHMHFLVWMLYGSFLRKMLEQQGYPIKQDLRV